MQVGLLLCSGPSFSPRRCAGPARSRSHPASPSLLLADPAFAGDLIVCLGSSRMTAAQTWRQPMARYFRAGAMRDPASQLLDEINFTSPPEICAPSAT